MFVDFHTHTVFSDGGLVASELLRRYECAGYSGVAITDHVDSSNIEFVIPNIVSFSKLYNKTSRTKVIPGVELTHIPVGQIKSMVDCSRKLGAKIVLVHGETIVEPVMEGTNREAILAGADILAHPGIILEKDVRLAAAKGVFLEISSRRGHSLANGHVAKIALKNRAQLIYGTDFHEPSDLCDKNKVEKVLYGSGLDKRQVLKVFDNMGRLFCKVAG